MSDPNEVTLKELIEIKFHALEEKLDERHQSQLGREKDQDRRIDSNTKSLIAIDKKTIAFSVVVAIFCNGMLMVGPSLVKRLFE